MDNNYRQQHKFQREYEERKVLELQLELFEKEKKENDSHHTDIIYPSQAFLYQNRDQVAPHPSRSSAEEDDGQSEMEIDEG